MLRETEFEQLQRIAEDHIEIHLRLLNWAAWSRDRIRQGHCRSIEFRYLAPRVKEREDLNVSQPPDALDAAAMHALVCCLPDKNRWILHLWYVHKAPANYIRRKLGLTRDGVAQTVRDARAMVRNRARRLRS